ncbi:transmembrane protein 109 [Carlito syrichta]|uniref:Transmembrane protein 109 n=1 Tax=Carlito syrichta TaxID=1868482 RepID=A0A3Q0DN84_CARSF|nr:transmembrane protein 109 [Carlito syrichta]
MASSSSSSPWGKLLFKAILMVLVALVLLYSASAQSHRDFAPPGQQRREAPADLLTQIGRSVRETLDDWIGPETTHLVSETLSQVLWAISSAISVAFFAVSGISAQLLNALGLDGDHLTQGLKLSPGQVQTFLLWGAGALVTYWLLSLLLGLALALLGRILWGLKLVLFLAGFVALVRSVPDPATRALLLLALLTLYALLSRLTGSRASGAQLEAKVRGLERQVEELRWRQRREGALWLPRVKKRAVALRIPIAFNHSKDGCRFVGVCLQGEELLIGAHPVAWEEHRQLPTVSSPPGCPCEAARGRFFL